MMEFQDQEHNASTTGDSHSHGAATSSDTANTVEATTAAPKHTDKDVDKYKGQARKEGKQTAVNELLEKFGVESVDELEGVVTGYRAFEAETQTETEAAAKAKEKAERERDEARDERDEAYSKVAEVVQESALRTSLANIGARPEKLDKLIREANLDALTLSSADDGEPITVEGADKEAERLKQEEADWFGSEFQPLPITPDTAGGNRSSGSESPYKPRYSIPGG